MPVGIIAQTTVSTTSPAPTLTSPPINALSAISNGVLIVLVVGTRTISVTLAGTGQPLIRRGSFGGPNGTYVEIWYLNSAPPGVVQVTATAVGAPTDWGFGCYIAAPSIAPFFDPLSLNPLSNQGGGPVAVAPYATSVNADMALVVVSNNNGAMASAPGEWTPLAVVSAGTQMLAPFASGIAPANPNRAVVIVSMSSPTTQWLTVSDAILEAPMMSQNQAVTQSCFTGPAASTMLPGAPAPIAAPAVLAKPRAVYNRCEGSYVDASGSPTTGP